VHYDLTRPIKKSALRLWSIRYPHLHTDPSPLQLDSLIEHRNLRSIPRTNSRHHPRGDDILARIRIEEHIILVQRNLKGEVPSRLGRLLIPDIEDAKDFVTQLRWYERSAYSNGDCEVFADDPIDKITWVASN
jgi:hypothetical protein